MSIRFTFEKETKGAVRYKEASAQPIVGTLYLKKARLKELGLENLGPIIVTIEKEEQ